ncbi:hypothetical protein LZ32DRAFT_412020 [Colletotrichum eremochloae]|nr:hypothetical protein LZ32DRAFT_412020 [Colletotrichum eremochloae]
MTTPKPTRSSIGRCLVSRQERLTASSSSLVCASHPPSRRIAPTPGGASHWRVGLTHPQRTPQKHDAGWASIVLSKWWLH